MGLLICTNVDSANRKAAEQKVSITEYASVAIQLGSYYNI